MMVRETRTILFVDDSMSVLLYVGTLLKRLGYTVTTARNAEDALHLMENAPPSVVLADIFLPAMNGVAFIKQLKNSDRLKSIPLVVLTSNEDPGMREVCMRMGCAGYLLLPMEPDELYRTLQAASESMPRGHIRLNTSIPVIVGDGTALGGSARSEQATAISEGGLYVKTRYPQPRNALTPVRIFINDREIRARTVVLYSYSNGEGPFADPGMGMKFIEIADADRELIRDFIREKVAGEIAVQETGDRP
jgi:two-component system chemotaxis response regulator CheY